MKKVLVWLGILALVLGTVGSAFAGVAMVTIPLMLVFAYFQKYFVAGLTNGAVKG
ncbi:MAG: hypothetical protein ACOX58_13310 [Christensenellales bacterium]|jgi:ABC-type maltose transport system permease subunit